MKYMTPELLTRFRSENDAVADAAAAEWDRQCEAYREHLKTIRASLSRGARRLLARYDLHDAKVRVLTVDEDPYFSIHLELNHSAETGEKRWLELRYRLIGRGGFEMVRHEALVGDGPPRGWWLYDEMDMTEGDVPVMTHSILLTGGYEILLKFFSVSCRRLKILDLPADEEGALDSEVAGGRMPLKDALPS